MILEITKEKIFKLKQNNLTIEDYFVLKCLETKQLELLDSWDNMFKSKEASIIYQKLIIDNFIELDSSEQNDIFNLTEKGVNLITNIC